MIHYTPTLKPVVKLKSSWIHKKFGLKINLQSLCDVHEEKVSHQTVDLNVNLKRRANIFPRKEQRKTLVKWASPLEPRPDTTAALTAWRTWGRRWCLHYERRQRWPAAWRRCCRAQSGSGQRSNDSVDLNRSTDWVSMCRINSNSLDSTAASKWSFRDDWSLPARLWDEQTNSTFSGSWMLVMWTVPLQGCWEM